MKCVRPRVCACVRTGGVSDLLGHVPKFPPRPQPREHVRTWGGAELTDGVSPLRGELLIAFFFSFLFYLKLACAGHVAGCIEAKEAKHYARVLEVLYGCQLIPKRTRWHLDCTRAPRQHSGSLRPHTLLLLWWITVSKLCFYCPVMDNSE